MSKRIDASVESEFDSATVETTTTSIRKQKNMETHTAKHFDFISFNIHTRSRKNRKTVKTLNFAME